MSNFNTPILFIIFNRPHQSKISFERIRSIKPKYLFIAADGPRSGNQDDEVKCKEVREVILSMIDWDCEVKTLFRIENFGCRFAPPYAISWFFDNVEQGIIIEDDCLLDISFFRYCEEMLEYYKNEEKIMHIGAQSFLKSMGQDQYYFANTPFIWGWATWKRAWTKYDINISDWPQLKKNPQFLIYKMNREVISHWEKNFDAVYNYSKESSISSDANTWDYQWTYCLFKNEGLAIFPNKNLVSNIGFGPDATHTVEKNSRDVERPTFPITFPLKFKKGYKKINKANYFMEKENWRLHKPSKHLIVRVIVKAKHFFDLY
jgi:hypothetical protein